jgi:acyl carrier protein
MSDALSFERRFQDVLEDVLGWGTTYLDTDGPASVEAWDSLAQIRLVNALETTFGVRLPDEALLDEQTVGSLKRLVTDQGVVA